MRQEGILRVLRRGFAVCCEEDSVKRFLQSVLGN